MAPNKMASLSKQISMVSSGKGLPVASMATAPIRQCVYVNSCPNFSATASSTFIDCCVTSGPIPSPLMTAMFFFINGLRGGGLYFLIFELTYFIFHAQQVIDIIVPIEQT